MKLKKKLKKNKKNIKKLKKSIKKWIKEIYDKNNCKVIGRITDIDIYSRKESGYFARGMKAYRHRLDISVDTVYDDKLEKHSKIKEE